MPKAKLSRGTKRVALGIDPSLRCTGLAVVGLDDDYYDTRRLRPKSTGVVRLNEIYRGIEDWLTWTWDEELTPVDICMEAHSFAVLSGSQGHALGEGSGAIKMALFHFFGQSKKIGYPTLITPQQVKKFVLGSGNAKKNLMLKGVLKKYAIDLSDDNEADAFGLAKLAAAITTGTDLKYEQEVLDHITRNTEWQWQTQPQTTSSTKRAIQQKRQSSGSEPPPTPSRLRPLSRTPSTTAAK